MAHLEPSDHELVRRIRDGDEAAFRVLADRYADSLFALARSLLGNVADAEDVVQETFLGAFRRLGAFEGRSSVKTWLTRILLNQASKWQRSKHVRRAVSLQDDAPPAEAGVERGSHVTAVEGRIDAVSMLQQLSPEHRQVLVLRELEQLSYEEMADVLRLPRGTVESRLHRARNELRRRFADYFS